MHVLLRDQLEGYLSGNLSSDERTQVEAHLGQCSGCREEFERMRRFAVELRALRPPADEHLRPAPGFYARVRERIERDREIPFWSMLIEPAFGRRLVFACLLLLALLGGYVAAFDKPDYPSLHRPEAILAGRPERVIPVRPARLGRDLEKNRSAALASLVADGD